MIKKIFKKVLRFKKNRYSMRRNFSKVATGNGVAFIITLVATPIVTRLYSPEALGLAAVFASILAIISVLACMRYEMAILLPDNKKETINLLVVCLCFSILTALFTLPFIWVFGKALSSSMNIETLAPLLWLLPIGILADGIFSALNFWNTRNKRFTIIAVTQVTGQTVNAATVLVAGTVGAVSGASMILGALFAKIISVMILGKSLILQSRELFRLITLKDVTNVLIRYKKFPVYGSWSILLSVAAWQLPILLLGVFFSSAVVGFYALGYRILQLPMSLVGNSLQQVFFQRAIVAKNEKHLPQLVNSLFDKVVAVSLFPMLMLSMIGGDLFTVFFGEKWKQAGIYTQILSLWAFFWFLSGPFTKLFAVLEKQEIQLKWNILNFTIRLLSILIGAYFQSAILTVVLLGISGTFIYAYKVFITLKIANASIMLAVISLVKHLLIFAPAGLCIFFISLITEHSLLVLAITVSFCCLYYFYIFKKLFPKNNYISKKKEL
jgi:O-antigen/teichoic acid export membrane protein